MIAHNPVSTLRTHIVRPKMPRNVRDKSEAVYKFNRTKCKTNYIVEMGNKLATRLQENQHMIKLSIFCSLFCTFTSFA